MGGGGRGMTIYYQEPKLAKHPSRRPHDRAVSALAASRSGPSVLDEPWRPLPKGPERPALRGKALPARHFGLVTVITVVDLLFMAASFVVPGELTGCWRVGMD